MKKLDKLENQELAIWHSQMVANPTTGTSKVATR